MLRITIDEAPQTLTIILAGRLTGAWVAELGQAWKKAAQRRNGRAVSLDLRSLLWADEEGKRLLREIEEQTGAELVATTLWTKHLAAEIAGNNQND